MCHLCAIYKFPTEASPKKILPKDFYGLVVFDQTKAWKSATILERLTESTSAKFGGSYHIQNQLMFWLFYQSPSTQDARVRWGVETVQPILKKFKV